jgi:hypothetical protein
MKNLKQNILLSAFCAVAILSCKENKTASRQKNNQDSLISQSVKPPFAAMDIPFDNYLYNSDSSIKITRNNGTFISIGPNTFQYKNGQPVTKQITLKIREFHKAKDILRAGIPMTVNAGKYDILQSAGMIELRAFENNEELVIKDGKSIGIELANFRDTKGYSLYHLDDASNWKVKDTFAVEKNARKASKLKRVIDFITKPFVAKKNIPNSFFELVTDTSRMPHLLSFQNSKWKIIENKDPKQTERIMRIIWDEIEIKPIEDAKLIYNLTFKSTKSFRNNKDSIVNISEVIVVKATPLIGQSDVNVDSIAFKKEFEIFQAKLKIMQKEKERLESETDLVSSFKINKMGIWNIDFLMKMEDLIPISLSFDFEKEVNIAVHKVNLFMIYEDANSVLRMLPKEWKNTTISKNKKVSFVAVLPNNILAVVDSKDITARIQNGNFSEKFTTKKISADMYFK